MRLADLTIKQIASICKKYQKNLFKCDENCPFFRSQRGCFLAGACVIAINDKVSEKEIDQHFIESEIIDDTFYMNRFMEVS